MRPQPVGVPLRAIAYYWGMLGVVGFIASAVLRLSPRAFDLLDLPLGALHWLALALFVPYMAYAEGYKGFHRNFAPRVVARALYLRELPQGSAARTMLLTLLAPAFCMGYFYATRKRMLTSWLVTLGIVVLVAVVRQVQQPWRGVIDVGVVTGLALGVLSVLWHWLAAARGIRPAVPLDLPPS
jgi:drug/metabolite transporter (DMT)-like permease